MQSVHESLKLHVQVRKKIIPYSVVFFRHEKRCKRGLASFDLYTSIMQKQRAYMKYGKQIRRTLFGWYAVSPNKKSNVTVTLKSFAFPGIFDNCSRKVHARCL